MPVLIGQHAGRGDVRVHVFPHPVGVRPASGLETAHERPASTHRPRPPGPPVGDRLASSKATPTQRTKVHPLASHSEGPRPHTPPAASSHRANRRETRPAGTRSRDSLPAEPRRATSSACDRDRDRLRRNGRPRPRARPQAREQNAPVRARRVKRIPGRANAVRMGPNFQ
jgi:hypothetical protein